MRDAVMIKIMENYKDMLPVWETHTRKHSSYYIWNETDGPTRNLSKSKSRAYDNT